MNSICAGLNGKVPFMIGSLRGWLGWRDRLVWEKQCFVHHCGQTKKRCNEDDCVWKFYKRSMRHIRFASCNSPQLLHRPRKGIVHNSENCNSNHCSALVLFNVFKWMSDWLVRLTSASLDGHLEDFWIFGQNELLTSPNYECKSAAFDQILGH